MKIIMTGKRPYKAKQFLTSEELVQIYEGTLVHNNQAKIVASLNAYMRGTYDRRYYSTYARAASIIRKKLKDAGLLSPEVPSFVPKPQRIVEEVEPENTVTTVAPVLEAPYAPYRKLEEGQRLMMEAILEIAEAEAQKRAEAQVEKLSEEFAKKEAKLELVIGEARNSSVVGMLRKHFGN